MLEGRGEKMKREGATGLGCLVSGSSRGARASSVALRPKQLLKLSPP